MRLDLSQSMDAAMSSWGSAVLVAGQPTGLVNPAEVRYTKLVEQPWRLQNGNGEGDAAENGSRTKREPFAENKSSTSETSERRNQKVVLKPVTVNLAAASANGSSPGSATPIPATPAKQQWRQGGGDRAGNGYGDGEGEWEAKRPVEEGLRSLLEEPPLPSASARLLAADLSLNPATGALTARSLLPLTVSQRHPLAFALPPLSTGPAASLLGTCAEFQATRTTRTTSAARGPLLHSTALPLPVDSLPRVLFVSSKMSALEARL